MYINPNSTIKILNNVPLDNTYEHTIYFASSSAQSSYFSGLAKYTFEAQSYQRVKRGYIRVATNAENLYDCNYLMFQNSAFGTKWFYAFIKSVEYINIAVSEIEFEIDVMQTWHFNYNLQECFVEREHSATDIIGGNIIPENLDIGKYVNRNVSEVKNASGFSFIVDATIDNNYNDVTGDWTEFLGKEYISGLKHIYFNDGHELINWLNGNGDEQNAVKVRNGVVNIRIGTLTGRSYHTYNAPTTLEGDYVPRNKKLLTYPYTFMYVTNMNGNSATYPFEFFSSRSPSFYIFSSSDSSPEILVPLNYNGMSENKDEALTTSNFPVIPWSSSYYDYWLAQTQTTKIPNMLTNVFAGGVTGAVSTGGNPVGVGVGVTVGAFSSAVNLMCEKKWAEIQPPQAKGNASGTSNYWADMIGFVFSTKSIRGEIARSIDEYFDKFGYATHRNKIPNTNVRPHWTYTKTVGCTIKGSVPCDDMHKICSIYDKGVTFWRSGDEIGNYSLDNSV